MKRKLQSIKFGFIFLFSAIKSILISEKKILVLGTLSQKKIFVFVPNNIRDNVPNTKNSFFQLSSTMPLIPKKMSQKTAGIRDIVPNTEFLSLIPNSV